MAGPIVPAGRGAGKKPAGPGQHYSRSGGRRGANGPSPRNGSTFVPKSLSPAGKLGRAVTGKNPLSLHLNVLGLQHYLRNLGYNVAVDGKLGPITKNALKDAIVSGTIKHASAAQMHAVAGVHGGDIGPKQFDRMIGRAGHAPFAPLLATHGKGSGLLNKKTGSFDPGPSGHGGAGSGHVNVGPTQKALRASTGQDIPEADANFGQLFDVDKTAKAMADEQFQPQINEQQLLVNRDPRQSAQNLADVKNWYAQVLAAQKGAGAQDAAATHQGVDATNAQTQALIQSLGGSANQGSGEAAAAGQNASGTLQAIGASQQGLDAELAPILAAQAAQQKTNQTNIDQAKLQSDQQMLQDLQGQEGNAETGAQMQLQSANNSLDQARQQALTQIMQYNNSLGQQKFQNQLGLLTSQIAAAMNGVGLQEKQAQANYYNARAAHEAGGSSRSASQLNDISNSILGALVSKGLVVGGNGQPFKMAPGVKPSQLLSAAQGIGSGYGGLPGSFIPNTVLGGIQGY